MRQRRNRLAAGVPWWAWLPSRRVRLVGRVDAGDEVPGRLPRRAALLAGLPDRPQWLVLDCPCCSGEHRLMLNLAAARAPRWTVRGRRKITVRPSVDAATSVGRCHFWIRNGRVVDARERP